MSERYKAVEGSESAHCCFGATVAWSGWGCQYPGKMPRLYGDRRIAELNCDTENGDQVLYFTATPQPAEQQPEVLAKGYFHPLPDENDYEFHAEENFPDGNDCPGCEPAVIVRKSAVAIQPAPDVAALVEALEKIAAFQPKDILCGSGWEEWNRAGEYAASIARDALAATPQPVEQQPAPDVAGLESALKSMVSGYMRLLQSGYDRITDLGGDCDPVDVMERDDAYLREARAALAAHRKQEGDV